MMLRFGPRNSRDGFGNAATSPLPLFLNLTLGERLGLRSRDYDQVHAWRHEIRHFSKCLARRSFHAIADDGVSDLLGDDDPEA